MVCLETPGFRLLLAEISSYRCENENKVIPVVVVFVSFWRRSVHIFNEMEGNTYTIRVFVSFWRRSVHI